MAPPLPVTGWRTFGFQRGLVAALWEDEPKLGPDRYESLWTGGEAVATCPYVREDSGDVCGRGERELCDACPIGIYAYATWAALQTSWFYTRRGWSFAARVELLGRIRPDPHGGSRRSYRLDTPHAPETPLRADGARVIFVVTLRPDQDVVGQIARRWGVPLVVIDDVDPAREPANPHG